jgi:hypothetical protein
MTTTVNTNMWGNFKNLQIYKMLMEVYFGFYKSKEVEVTL